MAVLRSRPAPRGGWSTPSVISSRLLVAKGGFRPALLFQAAPSSVTSREISRALRRPRRGGSCSLVCASMPHWNGADWMVRGETCSANIERRNLTYTTARVRAYLPTCRGTSILADSGGGRTGAHCSPESAVHIHTISSRVNHCHVPRPACVWCGGWSMPHASPMVSTLHYTHARTHAHAHAHDQCKPRRHPDAVRECVRIREARVRGDGS